MRNSNSDNLGSASIPSLLIKLSLPAVLGMLANALYNIIDTIFIGQGVGSLGIAAVAISLPIQMIILAISCLIGIGAGSMTSRSLGSKDMEQVNYIAGNSFSSLFFVGILLSVFGFIFSGSIVRLFGATDKIFSYANDYAKILFIASFYYPLCIAGNNLLRAEGNAKDAMNLMLVGIIVNVFLDYVFIFKLNMGIKGAAWATVIGEFCSFIYLISYLRSSRTNIRIHFKFFKPVVKVLKEMLAIGFSAFSLQSASAIVGVVLNHSLGFYGGEIAIAVCGVVYKFMLFLFMPLVGLKQGMQPILGYNYGARQFSRVKEVLKLSIGISFIMAFVVVVLAEIFPVFTLRIFSNDSNLIYLGIPALRTVILFMPFIGIHICSIGFFQSIGRPIEAFVVALLRQILLFLPLITILPKIFPDPLMGIWLSFPISDFFAVAISGSIFLYNIRKIERL